MIDPVAAIITYLRNDSDLRMLVADRIAERHKFGMGDASDTTLIGWPNPSKALQISADPGAAPDLYGGMERMRLDVICYGERPEEALRIYRQLVAISDAFNRTTVQTGDGRILLYWFYPDGSVRFDKDPDVHIDIARCFFRAAVAKVSV